jgi:hypothetical protein
LTPLVPIALFGWIPVVLFSFAVLPPRRAVIATFLIAWLFLPMAGYDIPGFPDYTKMSATCVGVLLGAALFDGQRLLRFRPRLLDLPVVVYCLVQLPSSVSYGWGTYEGLTKVLNELIFWGLPYFIGRLYFDDLRALRELAVGVFIGGVVYMPLCLLEIRISPQLHTWVYGWHQHSWIQTIRGGGYRPTVFMQHGLAVGTFMCTAGLIGLWLWRSRSLRSVMGIPTLWLALGVAGTAVLCKSSGATGLMMIGLATLWATRWFKRPLFAGALILAPTIYILVRTVLDWEGGLLVEMAAMISQDRANSLQSRLNSETVLWALVQPQKWFGAGRFIYAMRQVSDEGPGVVPDGMWIIALGCNGLIGLTAFVAMLTLPPLMLLRKVKARYWSHPAVGGAAVLAVVVALYMADCLFNAMINPIFMLAVGGLVTVATLRDQYAGLARATPATIPPPRPAPRREMVVA